MKRHVIITINMIKSRKKRNILRNKRRTLRKCLPFYSGRCYTAGVKANKMRSKDTFGNIVHQFEEGIKMYSVFDVANWFLGKEPMEHKKIQKLCYYAQAWSLALNDAKLIDSDFEAWVHGPVSRQLWNALRSYGYNFVDSDALKKAAKPVDDATNQFLERVWATYKDFNGFQLESLTHKEMPWLSARIGLSSCEPSDRVIDNRLMKNYYRGLVSAEGVGE